MLICRWMSVVVLGMAGTVAWADVAAPAEAAAKALQAASAAQSAASAALAAASAAASAASVTPWVAPPAWVVYLLLGIVCFGALLAIAAVRIAMPQTWTLAEALSEEVLLTPAMKVTTTQGAGGAPHAEAREPIVDSEGKPVLLPAMKPSSSRVIALMGMMAILFMFIGFGVVALYGFAQMGRPPQDLDKVVSYLVAGATLFAPYVVNKFASLFEGLIGKR